MAKVKGSLPKARKENLIIEELAGEMLVYDTDRDRAHCLNEISMRVWKEANGRRTLDQITARMRQEFSSDVTPEMVAYALDRLGNAHLLETRLVPPGGMTRRELARNAGRAAAIGLPVIASLVAPTPAKAQSSIPDNKCKDNSVGACCESGRRCVEVTVTFGKGQTKTDYQCAGSPCP